MLKYEELGKGEVTSSVFKRESPKTKFQQFAFRQVAGQNLSLAIIRRGVQIFATFRYLDPCRAGQGRAGGGGKPPRVSLPSVLPGTWAAHSAQPLYSLPSGAELVGTSVHPRGSPGQVSSL